jgi:2'-5' RNA ligase
MAQAQGPNTTALIVAVPEAEPVVGELRRAYDPSAAWGVPAHVTVLFPFVPAADVDRHTAAMRELFAETAGFEYRFSRVGRFGDTTVYLAPEPQQPFTGLTRLVAARWPEYPPYEGVHDVVIPHLTVGDMLEAETADRIETMAVAALDRHGPISGRATAVTLIVEDDRGQWSTGRVFPIGLRLV